MKKSKDILDPLFLTKDKINEINTELLDIEAVQLPEIQRRMATAYEDGDLPENNPWIAANNDLQEAIKRRNDLRRLLHRSKQFEKSKKTRGDKIGKNLVISINGGEEQTILLVTSEEADPLAGRLSCDSPIGKALSQMKAGQESEIETPGGRLRVKFVTERKRKLS
jgi:transcription elongation factor GreA